MLGCSRGAPRNEAEAVARRFVDLYFVEIDQEKALPLTTGPARAALEKELLEVRQVRQGGYRPEEAKATVYYEQAYLRVDEKAGSARAIYDLDIEAGPQKVERHVLLTLHNQDGGSWRVATYTLKDGPAQRGPAPKEHR